MGNNNEYTHQHAAKSQVCWVVVDLGGGTYPPPPGSLTDFRTPLTGENRAED